jgi:hypothetical protein
MYKLNQISRNYVKSKIGVSFNKILKMSSSELDSKIEKNINKKLEHKPLKDNYIYDNNL